MRLCRESKIVACLCLADLVSTIWFVRGSQAAEGNPLMSFYLEHGLLAFIGAKSLLVVPPLLVAEWYRRKNPRLVVGTLRLVIVLYVGLYSAGVLALNRGLVDPGAGWESSDHVNPVIHSRFEAAGLR